MKNYLSLAEQKFLRFAVPFYLGWVVFYFLIWLIISAQPYPPFLITLLLRVLCFSWSLLRMKHCIEIAERNAIISKILDLLAYIGYFQFVVVLFYMALHFILAVSY